MYRDLITGLQSLNQASKICIIALSDFVVLSAAVLLAYCLRISDFQLPPYDKLPLYVIAPFISIAAAGATGVYFSVSRTFSGDGEKKLVLSQLIVPFVWAFVLLALSPGGFARSVVVIYTVLAILLMIGLRRVASSVFNFNQKKQLPPRERIPIVIYGAAREGLLLAETLKRQGLYKPVAFLDTDYTLVGRTVGNLNVYAFENLDHVVTKFKPKEVIIAKTGQNRSSRRVLVNKFMTLGLAVKTVPSFDEMFDGSVKIGEIRSIKVEDLLGRDPVPPDKNLMDEVIKNQVLMVTGAGGSIGSEIVRQTLAYGPSKLILVDNNEFSLFQIHRELEGRNLPTKLVPLLADVQDFRGMSAIFAEHEVDAVFHAAAFKHVRMVQENAIAGIKNNICGTKIVAEAAIASRVKRFVLISTDKAVRPTSIMGATKRISEMVVQALAAEQTHRTILSIVRFGNVLGSTGSVVPLFQEQIAKGGPVLVTDPEVTRYFMLISEAAQLVIQAGAMAEGGEVFVLEMGESVKILRLAETMIELAGLSLRSAGNLDGDISIVFTGLKDGEKLYEELLIGPEVATTGHPRIMKSREFFLSWREFSGHVEKLTEFPSGSDEKIILKNLESLAHMSQQLEQPLLDRI